MSVTLSPPMFLQFFDPNNSGAPLAGGKLFTYVAGTSVKQATWTDSTQTIQNSNPIILDSNGAANVWLDPGLIYKFVLSPANDTDPPTSPLRTVDNIESEITNRVLSVFVTQSIAGHALYPQTSFETTAGVVIINFGYPPMHVRRYGAVGDGVTDDSNAFQSAINVARTGGGFVTWDAPTANYLIQQPLDCTTTAQPNIRGWGFRPNAGTSYDLPTVIFKHNGHAFDCTGTTHLIFDSVNFGTDSVTYPKTCFFLARNSSNGSAGWHRFLNTRIQGKFSGAILYNYASEDGVYQGSDWTNQAQDVGARVVWLTAFNRLGYTSTFQPLATGSQSCIDHEFFGGQFHMNSNAGQTDVIASDGASTIKIYATWMFSGSISGPGRSLIFIDGANSATTFLYMYGNQGENSGANTQLNGLLVSNDVQTHSGFDIQDWRIPNGTLAVNVPAGPTIDSCVFRHFSEVTSHGIAIQGVAQNCTFDSDSLLLNINTSTKNNLIGDSSRWTVGTRSNDNWTDTGAVNKTWTPVLGTGFTVTGALSINNVKSLFYGNLLFVTFTASAATSIAATASAHITGMPAAASARSGDVSIVNSDTGAALAVGAVVGTNIICAAFSVGANVDVTVTATFPVA